MYRYGVLILLMLTAGCASNNTSDSTSEDITNDVQEQNITACPAERSQICAMIYAPVCAMTKEGERKTFASDCVACGDENVVGFEKGGPCPSKESPSKESPSKESPE